MSETPTPVEPSARDPRDEAQDLAVALVEAARKFGADAADATAGSSASLSASARDGVVEELARSQSRGAAVRVIVGGRLGFATSSDAPQTVEEIEQLARTAIGLARLATPSPHNVVLPVVEQGSAQLRAEGDALGTWDDDTALLDADWAAARALEMERIVRGEEAVIGVRDVSAGLRRAVFALATSTGFVGASRGTMASLSCSAVVQDGDGGKLQIESWWEASRRRSGLPASVSIAQTAAARARARRGARAIPSAALPVVFDPNMARGFLVSLLGAISGEAVARKQSWLLDAVGEQVLPAGISLVDDPRLTAGFASRVFDGEGQIATRRTIIDERGVLTGFLLDGRSAARLGTTSTGHASRGPTSLPHVSSTNVTLLGGEGTLDDLVRGVKRGVLVTRLLGRSADPTTGDVSRGAAGFRIEDGALAGPVEGITIAGNAREMCRSLDAVGGDLDARSAIAAPSLRFASLSVGGTSG